MSCSEKPTLSCPRARANRGAQAIEKLSWGSGPSWCFTQSISVFSRGAKSCCCCCWSGVKSSLGLLENQRSLLSLLTHHKTVLLLLPVPIKSDLFHLASARTGLCATRNQTYGQSHAKPFGELLKKELGSGLVSSRMREGKVSSLFVVWQPESFLLLSLETRFFYICVIPGMFLLRVPVPQPGSMSCVRSARP